MAAISWILGRNGSWIDPTAWSGGAVPSGADDISFAAPRAGVTGYTVLLSTGEKARSVTQSQPGATLDIAGGTLAPGRHLRLERRHARAGGRHFGRWHAGPAWRGVGRRPRPPSRRRPGKHPVGPDVQGPLLLATQGAIVQVTDGLTVAGPSGALGTIGIEGAGDTLSIGGMQTLDHLSIGIGDPTASYLGDALFADGPGGQTSTLTLGAHAALVQTGGNATLAGAGDRGLVINRGSITAGLPGTFTLRSLVNAGRIAVGGGGEALLAGITNSGTIADVSGLVSVQGSLVNTGLIAVSGAGAAYQADPYAIPGLANEGVFSVGPGATASLGLYGYGWTNAGTLAIAGGLLSVGGSFSRNQLGRVQVSAGGTLGLFGTLTNVGTLAIGAGAALPLLALQPGGEIAGGVVADTGHGLLAQGGTLAGVTYRGALALSQAGALAVVDGGLTLAAASGQGTGSLSVTGAGSTLLFGTGTSLDHASVSLGGAATGAWLAVAPGQTLTLGSQATVTQAGGVAGIGSAQASVVNDGRILAGYAGGTLSLAGTFANAGTLAVSNGETLLLQTAALSNTGLISVSGGDLDVAQASAAQLADIRLTGGTVHVTGILQASGSTLGIGAGGAIPMLSLSGTLAGGTVRDGGGGLQCVGAPTLDGVSYQGTLSIDRPFTSVTAKDGLRLADATGALPGTLALTALGASLVWDSTQALDGATLSIGAASGVYPAPALLAAPGGPAVQLGSHLQIRQAGVDAQIGAGAGTFSSAATITANLAGGQFILGGDWFSNAGTLGVGNGDTVTAASGLFTNSGLIVLGASGAFDLNLFDYLQGGGQAGQSFVNAGRIQMAGGTLAELTYGGALPNVPMLNAASGSIAGAGVIASQIDNQGVIDARGGVLNLVQTVTGTGALQVDSGATLVLGGVGAGQTAAFRGPGGVLGLQPAYFLGRIDGFSAGDTIDLFNTHAQSASFAGSELDVALTSGATLRLHLVAPESGALSVAAGTHGDTLIRFAPALPNWPDTHGSAAWLPASHGI